MGHIHLVLDYGPSAQSINASRPDACAEVIADFLQRHEAGVISRARP
jgi:hypothetical protein